MPGFSDHGGIDYKHVQPTFGISFALPPNTPDASNHFNHHLYKSKLGPFGRSVNAGGINLGVAIVNPLLSLQIMKNEDGEKVYQPLIHFHVTPSQEKLMKITQLFDDKKAFLQNKHHHYHHAPTYPIPPIYPAHHAYPPQPYYPHYGHPPHYSGPPHHPHHYNGPPHHLPHYEGPPHHPPHYSGLPSHTSYDEPHIYSPNYADYEPTHYKEHDYAIHEPSEGFDDYYDDHGRYDGGEDYPQVQHRSSHIYDRSENVTVDTDLGSYTNRSAYSRSYDYPSTTPRANRGYQTFRFPDTRKKREIDVENMSVTVQEVIHALFLNSFFTPR